MRGWTVADLNYDLLGSLTRQGNAFGGIRRGRVNRNSVPPYLRLACGVGQPSAIRLLKAEEKITLRVSQPNYDQCDGARQSSILFKARREHDTTGFPFA